MTRPILHEIPMSEAIGMSEPCVYVTMSSGQWDALLERAYLEGTTLIELNEELPVRAFRLADHPPAEAHKSRAKQC